MSEQQILVPQRDPSGVFKTNDNATAFNELLNAIRNAKGRFAKRDYGTAFEKLSLDFLSKDATYEDQFTKVQLYSEWAKENSHIELNARDIGIDIVATNVMKDADIEAGKQTYTAIQCKFYGENTTVTKKDIQSFIFGALANRFTKLILIATNDRWSATVLKMFDQLNKQANDNDEDNKLEIKVITREDFANSNINWAKYLKTDEKIEVIRRDLRDYQKEALHNVIEGFKTNERGRLIMACGTGKTFTSLRTAEAQVGQHGLVLFLVPSLSLLSQTLSDWKQQAVHPLTAFAVCSDSKIGKTDDLLTPSELAYPATTNAISLAKQVNSALKRSLEQNGGMTVVFSTYQSIDVIAVAQNGDKDKGDAVEHPMPEFDLIICDEAHRTAGAYLTEQGKESQSIKRKKSTAGQELDGLKEAEKAAAASTTNALGIEEPALNNDVSTTDGNESDGSVEDVAAEGTKKANKRGGAKRTASIKVVDDEEAAFTRIHNNEYVKGKKRLYMTATPKVYGTAAREQENSKEAVLYSMDDVGVFGPVFHTMNFEKAVQMGCLVDYKVLILVGDANTFRTPEEADLFSDNHASRAVGAWKALNKYGISDELADDMGHMRRAVGFAQQIEHDSKRKKTSSKDFANFFQNTIDEYRADVLSRSSKFENLTDEQAALLADDNAYKEYCFIRDHGLQCKTDHIEGSLNALEKARLLSWLREEPEQNQCKILFNVRCLSEGVDVPSLDAVIFLAPRKSQVDVVQTVGRVMRIAPGKKRGYVIIPIVADDIENPEKTLERSEEFKVVWQVLNALRSINPSYELVDGRLEKIDDRIEVVSIVNSKITKSSSGSDTPPGPGPGPIEPPLPCTQGGLMTQLDSNVIRVEEAIKTAIIKKLGNIRTWEDWAKDVALICSNQTKNIKRVLEDSDHPQAKKCFDDFKSQMSAAINGHITKDGVAADETAQLSDDEFIDMLAQHIVIKPVLDELFKGQPFTKNNAIAASLTQMLETLQDYGMQVATNDLKAFYDSVGFRMKSVKSLADRQAVIVDLFDRFFKVAFPKQQEKLGIVYTPIEVVDFINHSVNDILKQEFGCSLGDSDVHILDPFTGTGTFITRMMQDETIIPRAKLPHKYHNELHAFELVPLSYYVASINIESVYDELKQDPDESYEANKVTVLTDTFATHDKDVLPLMSDTIARNATMRRNVDDLPLRVIVGNPPYSSGQNNLNDNNQNESYPELEKRIEETYVQRAGKITLKNSLYDSYIKAFRWASDKIGDSGIVAFVSNAGWIDSAAANGMRKCFAEEFNSIYVYHLKGNQRTSGEESRRQGGKIFGGGSRAPIAITILVKNPSSSEHGVIRFGCVDDYLSREEKLAQLESMHSVIDAQLCVISPDEHGDWLNQRREDYSKFISIDGKNDKNDGVIKNYSLGIVTNRDTWSYNTNKQIIKENFTRCIAFYESQLLKSKEQGKSFEIDYDSSQIKFDRSVKNRLIAGTPVSNGFCADFIMSSLYRPFVKQFLYNDPFWVNYQGQTTKFYPYDGAINSCICISGTASKSFSCLMTAVLSDVHVLESTSQVLPKFLYRKADDLDKTNGAEIDALGYVREDAIKEGAVEHFRAAYEAYGSAIDADAVFYYIYGIMHSADYRTTYAANLIKERPRIPRVATYAEFKAFEEAGRRLADLHVNYETVEPYAGCNIVEADKVNYRVEKLSYGKIKGKTGNAAKDKTCIVYNDTLTIKDIPLEAQEYVVNLKSALDWVVERCCVKVDKESGIVNDYNDYAAEIGDEKYIFNLILRVISVSLETVKIVKSLPALNIHPLDK